MLKAGDVKWVQLVLLICAQWLALGRATRCEDGAAYNCDEEIGCPIGVDG